MTPPVSVAVQGAYVVAVVCTGAILGGLAIIFKEITECLACLLGGFCLSMWLLTLSPGGLIVHTGGKVAFIAAFTLGGFSLYFTPWTRVYGLIACMSFSGATVAVLGIDCFSRAGLKEFWAYIWALNDQLFPLGAITYPLTRGIRVELAATILIFLVGVVSQLKLWSIIKERRDKRNAEAAEGEHRLRMEEENVGRQIEEMTERDRREWERVYGDGGENSTDSGLGDMDSEKRTRHSKPSAIIMTRSVSPGDTEGSGGTSVGPPTARAGTPLSLTKAVAAAVVIYKDDGDGRQVTVRVADDNADQDSNTPGSGLVGADESRASAGMGVDGPTHSAELHPSSSSVPPPVVSLPFTVPEVKSEGDRSSVATFADEEQSQAGEGAARNRDSGATEKGVVRRLSNGSAKIIRSLSQRSGRGKMEKHNTAISESREGLIEASQIATIDETESILVNMDDLSSDEDLESVMEVEPPVKQGSKSAEKDKDKATSPTEAIEAAGGDDFTERRQSVVDSTGFTSPSSPELGQAAPVRQRASVVSEMELDKGREESASVRESETRSTMGPKSPKSNSSIDSFPASLTRMNLPPALSRVAMSYRTNEWAKHLSVAEIPENDTLRLNDHFEEAGSDTRDEEPAPLDIVELQQTAENASPPPAAPRSANALSGYGAHPHVISRSDSRTSLSGYPEAGVGYGMPGTSSPDLQGRGKPTPYRSMSGNLRGRNSRPFAEPIAEEGVCEPSPRSYPPPLPEETDPTVAGPSTSTSFAPRELSASASVPNLAMLPNGPANPAPTTLIGMREMILRSKSHTPLVPPAGPPENVLYGGNRPPSDAGSIHNYPAAYTNANVAGGPGGGAATPTLIDADDIPLSQRRAMIRQSSMNSASGGAGGLKTRPSRMSLNHRTSVNSMQQATATAELAGFDSHQPARHSAVPPEAVRQAQLACFRSSVAAELPLVGHGGGGVPGFSHSSSSPGVTAVMLGNRVSTISLRGAFNNNAPGSGHHREGSSGAAASAADMQQVQRNIELQRNYLLGQKEMEAQRREAERREKLRDQREFDERMRSGALIGAHREAMRRIQGGVKNV